jgi:hypothetical protein
MTAKRCVVIGIATFGLSCVSAASAAPSDTNPIICGAVRSHGLRVQVRVLSSGVSCSQAIRMLSKGAPSGWLCSRTGGSNFFPAAWGYSCSTAHREVDFVDDPPKRRAADIDQETYRSAPRRVTVAAAGEWVQSIRWSGWGSPVATGTGESYRLVCPPDAPCSEATPQKAGRATITLMGSFICGNAAGNFDYYTAGWIRISGRTRRKLEVSEDSCFNCPL